MTQKLINLNTKSFFALLITFIMLFSIIMPTVKAAGSSVQTAEEIQAEVERMKKLKEEQERSNGVTGEIIDFSNTEKFNFDSKKTYESDHYKIVKSGHDYTITLDNLVCKKLILPLDDADQGNTMYPGSYSGDPRQTNITIILKGDNAITGYGMEGTCIKSLKITGAGNLSIRALLESKVEKVRKLNGATKEQLANPDTIPTEVKLTNYTVPGIRIETGDEKYQSNSSKYSPYSDSNSLVFAGTGNITINSPYYYGITNNGDIKFTSGNVKINSEKSAISAHRIIIGDEEETEFSLELDSVEKAFYDKPTFLGNNYIIMASKFTKGEDASIKSKEDVTNSYTSYRYIKASVVDDKNAPTFSSIDTEKIYCNLPTITVEDETAIDSITVNGVKVTKFTTNTSTMKTFVPKSNKEQKEIVAKDVLGNESTLTITAYDGHKLSAPVKTNEVKPTCDKDGSHINEYYCSICGELVKSETVVDKALGHSYGDWVEKDGMKERTCTVCKHTESVETAKDISNSKISLSNTTYFYDGTEKKPSVTVKEENKTLVKEKDYNINYTNNVNAGTATVTVTGKNNYKGTITAKFKIEKQDNKITASNITKNYSEKDQSFSIGAKQIGDAKLVYKSDHNAVSVDSTGKVTVKKEFVGTAKITITADETKGYKEATKEVTVTIPKIDNKITASNITKAYSEKDQKFSIGVKQAGDAKLTYSSNNHSIMVDSAGIATIKAGYVGTAQITITSSETTKYHKATKTITISTEKIDNKITASNITKSYSEKAQSFSIGAKQAGDAKLTYSSNNKSITVNDEGKVTIKAGYAGTAKITITSNETTKYHKATKTITVSTEKIDNSITASNVKKSFSKNDQSFSIGAKQEGDAKLTYSSNNKNVTVNASGKVTIKKEFVGTATITITAEATDGYNKATKKITVTVSKASNVVTAYNITKNFSEKAQSFSIGAKQTGDAKLTYSSNNKSITVNNEGKVTIKAGYAGTATITITAEATEKYNKTTKQITISTKKINNSIKASNFTKTYSTKDQSFSIGAKQEGNAKLTYSSNNKNVTVNTSGKVTIKKGFIGKATITITAGATDGYNKATKKITITVNPPVVKISKVTNSASKKMTVTWAKSTVVTGYEIQYSTDKNFKKDVKTTTVKKNSTKSTTISKLTKGKTYYVRIRTYKTVSDTKLYSSWSPVKNLKISK